MKKQFLLHAAAVPHSLKVEPRQDGMRLDAALAALFPDYGLRARRRLWEWCVVAVDGQARAPSYKVKTGQEIAVTPLEHGLSYELPSSGELTNYGELSGSGKGAGEEVFTPRQTGAPKFLLAGDLGLAPELLPDFLPGPLPTPPPMPEYRAPNPQVREEAAYIPAVVNAGTDYVAFFKPAGLPSAALAGGGAASLESLIAERWPEIWRDYAARTPGAACGLPPAPALCNRLDTATSGLLLGAFDPEGVERFRVFEREGKAKKKYLVMVHGRAPAYLLLDRTLDTYRRKTTLVLEHADRDYTRHSRAVLLRAYDTPAEVVPAQDREKEIPHAPSVAGPGAEAAGEDASDFALGYAAGLDGDENAMAGLRYLVGLTGPLSLLEVTILRGARHQIRAHLAQAGFPIVGDTQYGLESTGRGGRLYLHHSEINLPGFRAEAAPEWGIFTD